MVIEPPQPQPELILLTEQQLAHATGLSKSTIFRLRKSSGLPYVNIGSRVLYPRQQVEDYFAAATKREREGTNGQHQQ